MDAEDAARHQAEAGKQGAQRAARRKERSVADADRRRRFGLWLTGQLADRSLSQADFARRVGLTTGIVSQWTLGDRGPSPSSMALIADGLRLDVTEVMAAAFDAALRVTNVPTSER